MIMMIIINQTINLTINRKIKSKKRVS
jgi:hypothetical protein